MAYTLLLQLVRVSHGHLTVVFRSVRLQQEVPRKPSRKASTARNANKAPLPPTEQLGDLISFAGDAGAEDSGNVNSHKEPSFDRELMRLVCTPQNSVKKIDHMIEANLSGFSAQEEGHSLTVSSYYTISRRVHSEHM